MRVVVSVLSACLVASNAVPVPPGLFGISDSTGLVSGEVVTRALVLRAAQSGICHRIVALLPCALLAVNLSTAVCTPIGPSLPTEAGAQQLSAMDNANGLLYMMGYNFTSGKANLISFRLADGNIATRTDLSFMEPDLVGIGQSIAVDVRGRVIIGGQMTDGGAHLIGYVDPTTGTFTQVASLSPTLQDGLGSVTGYDVTTDAVIVSFVSASGASELLAVSMATGNVTHTIIDNWSNGQNVQALAYSAADHAFYGFGINSDSTARTLVRLDASSYALTVVGEIQKYLVALGPIVALDDALGVAYWMGAIGATTSPFYLVGVNTRDASIASAAGPIASPEPWSLQWYAGGPAAAPNKAAAVAAALL